MDESVEFSSDSVSEDSEENFLESDLLNSETLINSGSEVDTVATTSISEDEFISFNNNVCIGFSAVSITLGVVCGVILGLSFKGIFKD